MFCVYTEVIVLNDTVTFELLPLSKVDQSYLRIHEVPPLQYPKSHCNIFDTCTFHFAKGDGQRTEQ